MRPLPRVHALTDARVLARDDLAVRAAATAAAGSAVALHVRDRTASGAALTAAALRLGALARPPEAALIVNARPDIAAAVQANGVQLGAHDLSPADARALLPDGWIGRSVHGGEESRAAADEGADYLLVGNIFETASHPGRPAGGLALVEAATSAGLPVIAVGGMTAERARAVRDAGAWGVAAISAIWDAPDSYRATLALLEPWSEA